MKPINIYSLTRLSDAERLERLERQMSKRKNYMKIKEWELDGLRAFCGKLDGVMEDAPGLNFYYSFVMPKLGKEFDLLRVSEEYVVNVELKSGNVSDETIQKQLLQNRYYLATLGKGMYFYTYVSGVDRLVRLSNSGRLVEADWEELARVLERQRDCYRGHIEELFKEDKYLISPLTDPGRFLRQEYFLTFQQKDIKKQILKRLKQNEGQKEQGISVQGFTGFPGTGKTILLYDIAMQLSRRDKVCVFHFGSHTKELEQLNERLKRIDFYYYENTERLSVQRQYSAIFVDEGHKMDEVTLDDILMLADRWSAPMIISYDREDCLSPDERRMIGADLIEAIPGFVGYRLTNRIRLNNELSTFIRCVMCVASGNHRSEYPSVSLAYATNSEETRKLLHNFEKEGYIYIWDAALGEPRDMCGERIEVSEATCKEYAKVVMLINGSFAYDEQGYLRYPVGVENERGQESIVRNLFHGLSRAKENIAIVVENNEPVFDRLLGIVQRDTNKGR
ncbi:MAG: ATP-binding protein [Lachnospiraceae bacterium]|nr:ATP-binding protein [Lachnospiraceae bacterium]